MSNQTDGSGHTHPANLAAASNLSDLTSPGTARTSLGLGTAATAALSSLLQAANNLSDLVSASAARTSLGLGTAATLAASAVAQTANNLSDLASAATARTNLGVPAASATPIVQSQANNVAMINGTQTICSWTTPGDGNGHQFVIGYIGHVSSNLTGGQVQVVFTDAAGNAATGTLQAANQASGDVGNSLIRVAAANTTVSVQQNTAATGGAATMWAQIWGV